MGGIANAMAPKPPVDLQKDMLAALGQYIPFEQSIGNSDVGVLLGGTPSDLSVIASDELCFPADQVRRLSSDQFSDIRFQGQMMNGTGFLSGLTPGVQPGTDLDITNVIRVYVDGMSINYLSGLDTHEYYNGDMSSECKDYLDQFGFISQTASINSLALQVYNQEGNAIALNSRNVGDYLDLPAGMNWNIEDGDKLRILDSMNLGYVLNGIRSTETTRTMFSSNKVEDDRYVWERVGPWFGMFDISK